MTAKFSARARLASLQRHRSPDDPAIADARRELATESLVEHIARVVETAPTLTAEQIERLRGLLPPSAVPDTGEAA